MTTLIARRYDTNEAVELILDGESVSIQPTADRDHLPWLAPGFADWQVNGYDGIGFNSPTLTIEQVAEVSRKLDRFGVTKYLPTVTTTAEERFLRSLDVLSQAIEQNADVAARVPGIHVEGPYISPHDGPRGAHPLAHVRPPSIAEFERLQAAARGRIRLLTLSPEYDSAPEFIAHATLQGVRIAIGHTSADAAQIRRAVDAGAVLSTHLGNGSHLTLKRHPNYLWDQLAEDRLTASLIADGRHLPDAVLKTMLRAKTPRRCILVSDMTELAGCSPGRYSTSLGEVELLEDGRLVVAGQRDLLAGASLPISHCIGHAMRAGEVSLVEAMEMASIQPRRLLGLPTTFPGEDFVLFDIIDGAVHVRTTIIGGRVAWSNP